MLSYIWVGLGGAIGSATRFKEMIPTWRELTLGDAEGM